MLSDANHPPWGQRCTPSLAPRYVSAASDLFSLSTLRFQWDSIKVCHQCGCSPRQNHPVCEMKQGWFSVCSSFWWCSRWGREDRTIPAGRLWSSTPTTSPPKTRRIILYGMSSSCAIKSTYRYLLFWGFIPEFCLNSFLVIAFVANWGMKCSSVVQLGVYKGVGASYWWELGETSQFSRF